MKLLGRKPVIAVPYWPGSNGDYDACIRIRQYGMEALPLYFHFGNERRLEKNATMLKQCDGAFVPGGFPYEDRIGFGRVPASIPQFAESMKQMAREGKPVLAICAGDQIAQVLRLAFLDTPHKARMLTNICDKNGEIVYHGFRDGVPYTKLLCDPQRNAFTRLYRPGEVMPQIMDHGGGRFWADTETLQYLIDNDLIVRQYCDENGNVQDNFPINPNGSMLNIESITNIHGNVKLGMLHDERKTNALREDRANLSLASMREYVEDGCPDLSGYAHPGRIAIRLKDYSYLCPQLDPARTYDIYVKMLTDDNTRTTAQLFLEEGDIDRRRLIRLELREGSTMEDAKAALVEISKMDFLDGIMLKKDLPSVTQGDVVHLYEVVGKQGNTLQRDFVERAQVVEGFPIRLEDVSSPDPNGYVLKRRLGQNPALSGLVTNVQTGSVFFFPDESSKKAAEERLFY